MSKLPDDEYGRAVRYGHKLATETFKHIGPEVADPAMRYAGNNLACQSCHLDAATKPYAMPWIGVTAVFPQYRGRENDLQSVEDRVNGCMERSMAGKPLPLTSKEMRAFTAYIHFLSRGIPVGATVIGAATKPVDPPDRRADPVRGAAVYAENCAVCHGDKGEGKRIGVTGDAKGYEFPPIGGLDSFNDGAGMYRLLMAYQYIYHNMPLGTSHDAPTLTKDDAFDVAAYMETLPRQAKANMDRDFPNRLRKPVDMPFGPWAGTFNADAHKFGPFQPIQAELKDLQAAARAKRAAEEAAKAQAKPQ
jgi:thiosulfate dehydrogenase